MQMNVHTEKSPATISLVFNWTSNSAAYAGSDAQPRALKVRTNLAEAKDAISPLTQSHDLAIHAWLPVTVAPQYSLPQRALSPLQTLSPYTLSEGPP